MSPLNGGYTWSTIYNQPTAQFYHLAADNREPYYVYGTQQDNTSVAVPSRTNHGAITWGDCYIAGTGESGYIAVRPDDPDIVYVGAIGSSPGGGNCAAALRPPHRPDPPDHHLAGDDARLRRERAQVPLRLDLPDRRSPRTTRTRSTSAATCVFKSTDEGQSWEPISPDLTRADPETLKPTGGPVNLDAIGAETYATVFAFAESPHEAGRALGRVGRWPCSISAATAAAPGRRSRRPTCRSGR